MHNAEKQDKRKKKRQNIDKYISGAIITDNNYGW